VYGWKMSYTCTGKVWNCVHNVVDHFFFIQSFTWVIWVNVGELTLIYQEEKGVDEGYRRVNLCESTFVGKEEKIFYSSVTNCFDKQDVKKCYFRNTFNFQIHIISWKASIWDDMFKRYLHENKKEWIPYSVQN